MGRERLDCQRVPGRGAQNRAALCPRAGGGHGGPRQGGAAPKASGGSGTRHGDFFLLRPTRATPLHAQAVLPRVSNRFLSGLTPLCRWALFVHRFGGGCGEVSASTCMLQSETRIVSSLCHSSDLSEGILVYDFLLLAVYGAQCSMHSTFLEARTCSQNNEKYAGLVYLVCPKNADSVRWRCLTFGQPMLGYADEEKYPPCCWTWEDDLLQRLDEMNLPGPGAMATPLGRPGFEAVLPKQPRLLYRAIEEEIVMDPETENVEGPAAKAQTDSLSALLAHHQQSGLSVPDNAAPPQARRLSIRPSHLFP